MCGIAGFWGELSQSPDAAPILNRMTAALAHRGPDGQGQWIGANAALGHTRLAIIDLQGGEQPMWDAQGRTVITFNGEIYNFAELKRELESRGFTFRTRSDTEVISAAIDAWGIEEGLLRLRGMFAFALYDTRKNTMLLARDRVGIKPLYFAHTQGGLIFASEPKALLSSGLISRRVNPVAIHDYLAQGYATTPDTCWRDIRLLEPGTWLETSAGGIRKSTYWRWRPRENVAMDLGTATEKTRHVLSEALKYHMVSDVPVGAFLSGGLDSSLSVAMLSKGRRPGIQTFCAGFGDPSFDESAFAREVAEHCRTLHHERRLESGEDDPDVLLRVLRQYDEPFGDSSCIPTYLICGEMRQHVKVALSGDGGDEVMGGYQRYLTAQRVAALSRLKKAAPLLNPFVAFMESILGEPARRAAKAWRVAQLPRNEMLCALHTYFSETDRWNLYRPEFATHALPQGTTAQRLSRMIAGDHSDPMKQLMEFEFQLRLHADYLRKVDVASSAHGLEVRVPYLDNALLDLAAELPSRFKITANGRTKLISRRLAAEVLPSRIAQRRKKGFSIPLDRWLGPQMRLFVKDTLLSPQARILGWMKREGVERVWRDFSDEDRPCGASRFQRYQRLFLLISLEFWLREWEPERC